MKYLAKLYVAIYRIYRRSIMVLLRFLFVKTGKNFVFDPFGVYSYDTISVGSDVFIGPGAKLSASESSITIGNKVMFGPNVTIMGGDHNTTVIGRCMYDVKDKESDNDLPVIISDDVWLGAGCTVLKGVTVGEGAIVAAGALVISNVPPYSIFGGIPGKVLKFRFTPDEITKHKNLLDVRN